MKRLLLLTASVGLFLTSYGQIQNGGMEQWRNVPVITAPTAGLQAPQSWNSADSLIFTFGTFMGLTPKRQTFKSSDAHGGSFSAKLMTRDMGGSAGKVPGFLTNAKINFDITAFDPNDPLQSLQLSGGTPVSQRMGGISAYVKYAPTGTDTALMFVQAVMNNAASGNTDSIVGLGFSDISAASTYTQVYAPISYVNSWVVPTSIIVGFISSNSANSGDTSTLYVDNVSFVTLGINHVTNAKAVISVYPNPASNFLFVSAKSGMPLTANIYDLSGCLVRSGEVRNNQPLDISTLASGLYLYRLNDQKGNLVAQDKFSVVK